MKAGDMVLLLLMLHSNDEQINEDLIGSRIQSDELGVVLMAVEQIKTVSLELRRAEVASRDHTAPLFPPALRAQV